MKLTRDKVRDGYYIVRSDSLPHRGIIRNLMNFDTNQRGWELVLRAVDYKRGPFWYSTLKKATVIAEDALMLIGERTL